VTALIALLFGARTTGRSLEQISAQPDSAAIPLPFASEAVP
jgi:hypothetical protein